MNDEKRKRNARGSKKRMLFLPVYFESSAKIVCWCYVIDTQSTSTHNQICGIGNIVQRSWVKQMLQIAFDPSRIAFICIAIIVIAILLNHTKLQAMWILRFIYLSMALHFDVCEVRNINANYKTLFFLSLFDLM